MSVVEPHTWYESQLFSALIAGFVALIVTLLNAAIFSPRQEEQKRKVQLIDRVLSDIYVPIDLLLIDQSLYHLVGTNRALLEKNFHLFSADIQMILLDAFGAYVKGAFGEHAEEVSDSKEKIKELELRLKSLVKIQIRELRKEFIKLHGFNRYA